jgi:hypothetical protein
MKKASFPVTSETARMLTMNPEEAAVDPEKGPQGRRLSDAGPAAGSGFKIPQESVKDFPPA